MRKEKIYLSKKMYKKELLCTYCYYDKQLRSYVFDKQFDEEDVKDFEDMAEDIYRAEIVAVFSNTFDEGLEELLKEFPQLVQLAKDVDLPDTCILFSYDYFFYTHQCIKENCSTEMLENLKDFIKETN